MPPVPGPVQAPRRGYLPNGHPCFTAPAVYQEGMFTIEHEFDCTVVTLVDDGPAPLQEDVSVNAFAECVTIEQYDARTDEVHKITLSPAQIKDLAAALNLPEGSYFIPGKSGDAKPVG